MKRKDWKIKSSNKDIFGRRDLEKIKATFKKTVARRSKLNKFRIIRLIKNRDSFLRFLVVKRTKKLYKSYFFPNYFFYNSFLRIFKHKKNVYVHNLFFKTNLKKIRFYPEFVSSKNTNNLKNKGINFIKENNLKYTYLNNKYFGGNTGLNYYFLKDENFNYNSLIKNLSDENNLNLIHIKDFNIDLNDLIISDYLNSYFNYNLNLLQLIEVYKILTILYINKLNKKYIYVNFLR